ncbi:MAG TPA: hypothetical protein VNO52_07670, partial [Methylomirabilota bacterium]|nr:hypothetical protein [Methylomirabilota bacterium]
RGVDLGTGWRARLFNDAGWAQGAPLFAYESAALPEPIRTPLVTNQNKFTFYFRKALTLPGDATNALLRLRTVLDDGAVFHLNGAELFRWGMPPGNVSFSTPAARTVDNAVYEGPFILTPTNLVPGTNALAVEVHQVNATSSDVVFGASIEALVLPSQALPPPRLNASRNGTDLRLDWQPPARLETASSPAGPWSQVEAPSVPAVLPMTNRSAFYRLRR